MLHYCVSIKKAPEGILPFADLDGDGKIGAEDARITLRLSIGLPKERVSSRSVPGGKIIGYTAKNYPIYSVDGLIYIDGILIVNKTYSLPENYNPGDLLPDCSNAFRRMQNDATQNGLSIYISSGYRSYASQKSIYNRYVSRDGKYLADTYSARPGHSEHQTGLSIDLNTITRSFGNTAAGKWVAAHCHEYGFIIRYPEGKSHITGYCYEPWHLRYVGIDTASKIAASGLCLEEYYGITSTYS
ncbi:MAG: M15 family metallopeptidase [Clostridia bacterium]|nr:M15 family metallopeptidase [Clostridia bacterium]